MEIDRLGRATYELIKLMMEWKEMGVDFRSISEGIDTSTKMGRLWYMLSSVIYVVLARTDPTIYLPIVQEIDEALDSLSKK